MFTPQLGQASVLLVDDDAELVAMVAELLRGEAMQVRTAGSGRAALEALAGTAPDVLVLDVMLPDANGLELCRRLRSQNSDVPILMLTARGEPMDRVLGLELGADDYMGKPFDPRELVARIRALYRRGRGVSVAHSLLCFGELEIDLAALRVFFGDVPVPLSSAEFRLLVALARNAGKPVSREALSAAVQPGGYMPLDRAVDVQVARLRKKLSSASAGREWIATVRGAGYAFRGR